MSVRGCLGLSVAAACSLIVATGLAGAAAGDLDQTFGTAGRVLIPAGPNGARSFSSVVQPDGKIVLVGSNHVEIPTVPPAASRAREAENDDFTIVRLNQDGSLDSSFGSGGIVRTPIDLDPGGRDWARDVALGPGGTIVLAGEAAHSGNASADLAFVRYTSTGALDPSFSEDGIQTIDLGSQDFVYSVAVQPADGKIVAVGTEASHPVFEVVRLRPDGELDESFGTGGVVRTPIGRPSLGDYSEEVALAGSTIVAAGSADAAPGAGDFAIVRYLSDGRLDPSFGTGGIVVTPGPGDEGIRATVPLAAGKLLVAGFGRTFRLARYLRTGALDRSFGGTGLVTTRIGSSSRAGALVVEADGKPIAGGAAIDGGPRFALARYKSDGSLDASFGSGGTRMYPVGTYGGDASSLAIQHLDGDPKRRRLVQSGTAWEATGGNFAAIGIELPAPPPPPDGCRVPRVVSLGLGPARQRIRRAQCSVGRVRHVRARRRSGVVLAQSPRAGTRLAARGRVSLSVSRGRR